MIKIGIVGISGYSGAELLEILLKHKEVRVTYTAANNTHGPISEIWPQFNGRTNLVSEKIDIPKLKANCDLVFLATPHATSIKITPQLLAEGIKVIDLSGDYRLKSPGAFKKWYGEEHADPKNLAKAVYGLPEINREKIKSAKLIANPGCYATAAALSLSPLVSSNAESVQSIIIDAKSGVSGAGKKAVMDLMFTEVNENFKAYKVLNHQHTPEIEQTLSSVADKAIKINFVPHLLPVNRGILETIYVQLKNKVDIEKLHTVYKKFYKNEPFVRILALGKQVELKYVTKTNFCDIALAVDEEQKLVVITSAIDNLVKGAAGQAVQNMNIMCQFKEAEGLY